MKYQPDYLFCVLITKAHLSHEIRWPHSWCARQPSLAARNSVLTILHGSAPWYLDPLVPVTDLPGRRTLPSAGTNRFCLPSVSLLLIAVLSSWSTYIWDACQRRRRQLSRWRCFVSVLTHSSSEDPTQTSSDRPIYKLADCFTVLSFNFGVVLLFRVFVTDLSIVCELSSPSGRGVCLKVQITLLKFPCIACEFVVSMTGWLGVSSLTTGNTDETA